MLDPSIYFAVRTKLVTHGVDRSPDGLITLSDRQLFLMFVELERARRDTNFDKVLAVVNGMELYLASIGKRHVIVFAYMYLGFSELSPRSTELDEKLPDGRIRKAQVYDNPVSDEARLIGLWARVKYDQLGERFLAIVYSSCKA